MPGLIQSGSEGPLELRPYQLAAVAAVHAEFARGVRSTLVAAATGTGKTVAFADVARTESSHGRRTLILVHRDELLKQAKRKCEDAGLTVEIEKAKSRASLEARVVVASVQSLKGARLARFAQDHFGCVIVDEAHHAAAKGYRDVLDHFVWARVLGVTATPDRADGVGLGEIFDTLAYRYEIREAIRDRYLVPLVARRVVLDGVDLSAVKSRAGDLAQDELAAVMANEEALRGVVVPLLDLAGSRRTIVFGVDVAHAEALAATLNAYRPGCARAVSGQTGELERERLLAAFAAGHFQFLTNCALLIEGFDDQGIECVAMCRPTKSRGLFVQCAGRGLRLLGSTLDESIARGKRDCLLLDFTGRAGKHRLIGPVDCLLGAIDEDERAEIDRLLGAAQRPLEDVIAEAAEAVRQRSLGLIEAAVVKFHTEEIDPFIGADDGSLEIDRSWSDAPLPPQLVTRLKKEGVNEKRLPPTMSRADGERLLSRLLARRRKNLALLGQAKKLWDTARIDARAMPRQRADELLTMLRLGGWNPLALAETPEWAAAAPLRLVRAQQKRALEKTKRQRAAARAAKAADQPITQ